MSLIVKGFVTDSAFISNVKDEVASVFELSSKAYSYAKDKTHYSLNAYPGNDLIVFKAMVGKNLLFIKKFYRNKIFIQKIQ